MALYKDEVLDALAEVGNVAQFVSFRPHPSTGLRQTFCRVAGYQPNHTFEDAAAGVAALLASSVDSTVNVRSFAPDSPRSQEFVYGLSSVGEVLAVIKRLAKANLYLIVNETIDVMDGGVSGVVQGNVIEFSPDDTPRCVEKPGVASLPYLLAIEMLSKVYGFTPDLTPMPDGRVEFSIHPKPRGWRGTHTILWEREKVFNGVVAPAFVWPNRFSRHIGDKAFGLLVADHLSVPVPQTLVVPRRVRPFSFGLETGSSEVWTRTCPTEPHPGLFTTVKGWSDPFKLLADEDPNGKVIASVICQAAVRAAYSGAAIVGADGQLFVEGRHGEGDRLMLGLEHPEALPAEVTESVTALYERLAAVLGAVRFEWVYDGGKAWIVQLHRGGTSTSAEFIVPGEASAWVEFDVSKGLEALKAAIDTLPLGAGMRLVGDVGLTSHIADLARRGGRPTKLAVKLT